MSNISAIRHVVPDLGGYGAKAAVLFAEVDGLKLINDSYGHRAETTL